MDEIEDHDRGLSHDLPRLVNRRQALGLFGGGLGALFVAGCTSSSDGGGGGSTVATSGASTSSSAASSSSAVTDDSTVTVSGEIPQETGGPFPGDGTNGPNVLTESGVVRSAITSSFGSLSGQAEGIPTTVHLTLVDVSAGGVRLAGAAVYLWHCDREGRYSLYDRAILDQNYLRGVQQSAKDGTLTFTTIFPAAYSGRWPHMHFEIYPSLTAATSASSKLKTSQLAIPKDVCDLVYATAGYEQSVPNLARTSLDSDLVFGDGYRSQLAKWTGSVANGITLSLNVGV